MAVTRGKKRLGKGSRFPNRTGQARRDAQEFNTGDSEYVVRHGQVGMGAWVRDGERTGLGAEDCYGRSDDDQVKYGPAI